MTDTIKHTTLCKNKEERLDSGSNNRKNDRTYCYIVIVQASDKRSYKWQIVLFYFPAQQKCLYSMICSPF